MKTDVCQRTVDTAPTETERRRADAQAATCSANTVDYGHWYRAVTSLGDIFVALRPTTELFSEKHIAGADACLLDAARALGRENELLRMLEAWMALPLDLEPHATPEEIWPQVTMSPRASAVDGGVDGLLLTLSLDLLSQLPAPPAELETSYKLHWWALDCVLILDRFSVPRQQLLELEKGGLLLMPASFEGRWRCIVKPVMQREKETLLFLEANKSCLEFEHSLEQEAVANENSDIEVAFVEPVSIPLDRLLEWTNAPSLLLAHPLSSYEVEVRHRQIPVASGSLMPIGNGYGVCIEEMEKAVPWI